MNNIISVYEETWVQIKKLAGGAEKTRGSIKVVNQKRRLAFTDLTEANPLVSELMNRIKDNTKANLRGGTSAAGMVDFKSAKNLDKDNAKANVKDGTDTKKMVDFRGMIIADSIYIDWFDTENVNPIISLVDVKWHLQGFLSDATIERRVMAKLIQI